MANKGLESYFTLVKMVNEGSESYFTLVKMVNEGSESYFTLVKMENRGLESNFTLVKMENRGLESNFTIVKIENKGLESNFTLVKVENRGLESNFTLVKVENKGLESYFTIVKMENGGLDAIKEECSDHRTMRTRDVFKKQRKRVQQKGEATENDFTLVLRISLSEKESSKPMSRVLYRKRVAVSAINLVPTSQLGSSNLPLGIGRVALNQDCSQSPIYMILQPMGCTATPYCYVRGELLPRLFTLTNCLAVFLCYTLPKHCCLPVVSRHGTLCCPDFPHMPKHERQTVLLLSRTQS